MGTKSFGPFLFEPELGRLLRNGSALPVGVRAVPLLKALLEANGEPVTKGALIDAAWPAMTVEEVNLSVQIAALRKALGTRPDGEEWITTVPRIGYRLLRPAEVEKPRRVRKQLLQSSPSKVSVTDPRRTTSRMG